MSLGTPIDSKERILSGIIFVLRNVAAQIGHTCYPIEDIVSSVSELLGVSEDRISDTISRLVDEGCLSRYRMGDRDFVMPYR